MPKKRPKRPTNRPRKQSKDLYLEKRKRRVRELYEKEGLQARDIAARLVDEGTIETLDESLESAIRLVRASPFFRPKAARTIHERSSVTSLTPRQPAPT
jgi:hypothetical protein